MAIRYEPKKLLKKMASKKNIESLVTPNLTINRAVLNSLEQAGTLSKKELQYVGLSVLKSYREKAEGFRDEGLTKTEARDEVLENKKQLVQRVQNATVYQITKKIKEKYKGEKYTWLESSAAVPDKKHKRKYGKEYKLGRGEAPGDRFGCRCGMEILVDAKRLRLD